MLLNRTLGAGLLRLLLLLARLVRRPAGGTGERKKACRQPAAPPPAPAGRGRCGRCAPGWTLACAQELVARLVEPPPPRELQELIDAVAAGQPLDLYLRA
jgi:hypothetical protein